MAGWLLANFSSSKIQNDQNYVRTSMVNTGHLGEKRMILENKILRIINLQKLIRIQ